MQIIHFFFMTGFKGGDAVNVKVLMDHEQRIHKFEFIPVIHKSEIPGFRKTIGQMFSNSYYWRLINAVDIQGDAIRLSNLKGS